MHAPRWQVCEHRSKATNTDAASELARRREGDRREGWGGGREGRIGDLGEREDGKEEEREGEGGR